MLHATGGGGGGGIPGKSGQGRQMEKILLSQDWESNAIFMLLGTRYRHSISIHSAFFDIYDRWLYYTSTVNCPIKELDLYHVASQLIGKLPHLQTQILRCSVESFRFDYEYDYDYEIRHFWRQLLASSRADVIKS